MGLIPFITRPVAWVEKNGKRIRFLDTLLDRPIEVGPADKLEIVASSINGIDSIYYRIDDGEWRRIDTSSFPDRTVRVAVDVY